MLCARIRTAVHWAAWIRNASLGLAAFALVDFLERRPVQAGDWESMAGLASRWALGAVLAAAYARLVPPEHWGVQSGVAFAKLPVVGTLSQALRGESADAGHPAEASSFAFWGGLTGLLIHYFGAAPGGEAADELVLRLPKRA